MKFCAGEGSTKHPAGQLSTDAVAPTLSWDRRIKTPLAIGELANQEELQRDVKELKKHLQKGKKICKQKSVPG